MLESPRRRGRWRRTRREPLDFPGTRAFSVLELLIVLALIAALGALVFPPLWRAVGEYRFRETLRQFDAAMDACRASSQRAGRPVTLVVSVEAGGLRVRGCELSEAATPDQAGASGRDRPAVPGVLRFSFPPGFEKDAQQAGKKDVMVSDSAQSATSDGAVGDEVALFLPDGTAAAGKAWRVRDANGRTAEIYVDRWAGAVRLRAVSGVAMGSGKARP